MTNRITPTPSPGLRLTRRRLLVAGGALAAAAPLARPALAEGAWRPNHPVRILVPYPPGGATDMLARLISQKIGNRLGQPLVIENRPGASGIIATQNLLGAPADGHSLLLATADTHTVMPAANKKLPYKVSEFVPVAGIANVVFSLVVRPGLKVTDVPSLVRLAKAAQPPLTYASYGVASASHAAGEMFKQATGVNMVHVPYQGAGPAVTAITADQVDVMMVPVAVSYPQRERLRMLGVASAKRFAMVPDLPTLEEQGVPLVADAWIGLLAAPGTPAPVAESINAALGAALDTADFATALRTNGFSALGYGPEQFARYLKEEDERWSKVVHEANITVEI